MKFLKRLLEFLFASFKQVVTVYITSKVGGKTSEWKLLIGALLPSIFSYLERPIIEGAVNELEGYEKFQKTLDMVDKYLGKYVDVDVAQDDVMSFIQLKFFQWVEDTLNGKEVTEAVMFDGKEITLKEVL